MLLSMTGYGDAGRQSDRLSVAVEVRSINNRYLKVTTRCPDSYAALEGRIEKMVRQAVARGTVSVTIRADGIGVAERCRLDSAVIAGYWRQLETAAGELGVSLPNDPSPLLPLPGVVVEQLAERIDVEDDWPLLREALEEALEKLQVFRADEGRPMQEELAAQCGIVSGELDRVAELAPQVVRDYRNRLLERVRELLADSDVAVDGDDLIREVSIFSDRCDINEEITRLRTHLDQFHAFLQADSSQGRKLEFLAQEMFREVNTIGSKANNVEIAHSVVEMKSAVEKMREILQNVE